MARKEEKQIIEETVSMWIPTTNLMLLRRMGKLGEELGELQSVASRIIIQGLDETDPATGKINRDRLQEEIADVYAQLDETIFRLSLNVTDIQSRRLTKRHLMNQWEELFNEGKSK